MAVTATETVACLPVEFKSGRFGFELRVDFKD